MSASMIVFGGHYALNFKWDWSMHCKVLLIGIYMELVHFLVGDRSPFIEEYLVGGLS